MNDLRKNNEAEENYNEESSNLLKQTDTTKVPTASRLRDLSELMLEELPISDETACGIWCIREPFLQKFANKKTYSLIFGLSALLFQATRAYFKGTMTTVEKRYKISSQTTGSLSRNRYNNYIQ